MNCTSLGRVSLFLQMLLAILFPVLFHISEERRLKVLGKEVLPTIYKGFSPMVKDGMGLTPGATLCSGIQVFVQDLKGIEVDLASEKHELSVF